VTTDDVWLKVIRGELAPLDAFGRGQMRVLGSIEVARALVRGLCGS
jgi:putative sterol carrier protein